MSPSLSSTSNAPCPIFNSEPLYWKLMSLVNLPPGPTKTILSWLKSSTIEDETVAVASTSIVEWNLVEPVTKSTYEVIVCTSIVWAVNVPRTVKLSAEDAVVANEELTAFRT